MWFDVSEKPKQCGFYVIFNDINLVESRYYDTEKGWVPLNDEAKKVKKWAQEPLID